MTTTKVSTTDLQIGDKIRYSGITLEVTAIAYGVTISARDNDGFGFNIDTLTIDRINEEGAAN
jgi:hypothetical protein